MKGSGCAPVLVRVAGLPATAVEALGTSLPSAVDEIAELESRLGALREVWVDRLYAAIGDAGPEERGFLLRVKRDAFNGRPLAGHREHESWPRLEQVVGDAAGEALAVEARLAGRRERFAADHEAAVVAGRESLASWLRHAGFRCGLAIASPVVARNAGRLLRRPPDAYGRRERRLEPTLARYVSRAACKLSPFASFTAVALAEVVESGEPFSLHGDGWGERSLVRIKRYLLDQYVTMLEAYPPFRDRLRVAWNDSMALADDGRSLFLRPSHWTLDESGEKLSWHRDSLVKVRLAGELAEQVREIAAGEPTYRELIASLARRSGDAGHGEVAAQVDRLVEVGVLQLVMPWPADEGHLEKRLLEELGALPEEPRLERFRRRLTGLVDGEEGYPRAADPVAARDGLKRSVGELWRAAAPLGGLSPEVRFGAASAYDVYQDVVRVRREAPEGAPLAAVDADAAHRLAGDVQPLVAFSQLFDPRLDFLLALGDLLTERWPSRQVPLIVAFAAAQPLWQDFVRYQLERRESRHFPQTWDPRGLADTAQLERVRQEAWERLPGCLEADGEEDQRFDPRRLAAVVAGLPRRFRTLPPLGCLFVQPASPDGSLWVLNRIKEGTGRFGSRYAPALDPVARRLWCEGMAARGRFDVDGEAVDLLDVLCPQGDTLNVHAPQTPLVLTLPGARASVPPERQRRLGDLVVAAGEDGLPLVRDTAGRRLLPLQLGVGYYDYMPTLVKFLSAFGPNELAAVFPPPRYRRTDDGDLRGGRTTMGRLVLHRRSWSCRTAELAAAVERASDAEAFEAITRWRRERGIPDLAFLTERVPHPIHQDRFQPQYLDFSSPVFVDIFRSALDDASGRVRLVEMLPSPEQYPRDAAGRRWAVELLLDSLALRSPTRAAAAEPGGREAVRSGSEPIRRTAGVRV